VNGRNVVVSGAASGIGRATALLCRSRGAAVAALDIDGAGLDALAAEAAEAGPERPIVCLPCDVADESSLGSAFAAARRELGPITGVVASAGVEAGAPLPEFPTSTWDLTVGVNLRGTFFTLRQGVELMLADGVGGSMVCLSSPAAFVGFAGGGNAAYAASKGGISALMRSIAIDHAARGIRVNAVVPGATDTPMLMLDEPARTRRQRHRELELRAQLEIPLARMAQPVEIARAVVWLLSDESSYVTGSHLVCDGGLLAKSANTF
jgi:NAD(P)-dependent dehydrogenase (short-subunit alcohol dehydrogenase family)